MLVGRALLATYVHFFYFFVRFTTSIIHVISSSSIGSNLILFFILGTFTKHTQDATFNGLRLSFAIYVLCVYTVLNMMLFQILVLNR